MLPTGVATKVKVLLALEPGVLMAVMHTMITRASMTAYSTAIDGRLALLLDRLAGSLDPASMTW
jgi:hypothetical protein